jgi:hypothetical protein
MNPRKTTIAILAALAVSLALADDFKTTNGKEYKNATVSRVEPDEIVIRFHGGIVKLHFVELPKDVQERFNYHPVMASGATEQGPAHSQSQTQGPVSQNSSEQTDNRGASHILACRGTDQVLIGSSSVFHMKEAETYAITGISGNGNLMFATPLGPADYHGDRFRVLDGGQYGNIEVNLQHVRTTASGNRIEWTGQVVNTGALQVGQCYAALQSYVDGRPYNAAAKIIGTLDPGRAITVALSTLATSSRDTYSFHLWSAAYELKQTTTQEPDW